MIIRFATLIVAMALPATALCQAGGITLNLENENPLSKWGRWTYLSQEGNNYAFQLSQDRAKLPLMAHWSTGHWILKLNKDMLSNRHDLLLGLKINEDYLGTTSVGCMSNNAKSGLGDALCGIQLDLNLR